MWAPRATCEHIRGIAGLSAAAAAEGGRGCDLYRRATLTFAAPTATNRTGLGLGLGLLSAACACLVALAGLYGGRIVRRLPSLRTLGPPIDVLHRPHSGHVGDYVAFMMLGIGALAAFVGLPLR